MMLRKGRGGPYEPWSADDDRRLLALIGEHGLAWDIIAPQFPDRSRAAVKARRMTLKTRADGVVRQRSRPSEAKADSLRRTRDDLAGLRQPPLQPGQGPRYASLTAMVFRDPPIGRSALDKKLGQGRVR